MHSETPLDQIDRQILGLLQKDGRLSNVALARAIGVAPATTLERVRRLEAMGAIRGYTALVDARALGRGTTAFVAVTLASHAADEVEAFRRAIEAIEPVLECYHIAGEIDYLLKVAVPDIEGYESFLLGQLTGTPNVGKVHTSFVLSTVKHETRVPPAA